MAKGRTRDPGSSFRVTDDVRRELARAEQQRKEQQIEQLLDARMFGIRVRALLGLPEKLEDARVLEVLELHEKLRARYVELLGGKAGS